MKSIQMGMMNLGLARTSRRIFKHRRRHHQKHISPQEHGMKILLIKTDSDHSQRSDIKGIWARVCSTFFYIIIKVHNKQDPGDLGLNAIR